MVGFRQSPPGSRATYTSLVMTVRLLSNNLTHVCHRYIGRENGRLGFLTRDAALALRLMLWVGMVLGQQLVNQLGGSGLARLVERAGDLFFLPVARPQARKLRSAPLDKSSEGVQPRAERPLSATLSSHLESGRAIRQAQGDTHRVTSRSGFPTGNQPFGFSYLGRSQCGSRRCEIEPFPRLSKIP